MPLPEEYYNIVKQGATQGISTFPGMSPPGIQYPDYSGTLVEEPEPVESGTFMDLAKSFGAGGVAGLTWSAVDLHDEDRDLVPEIEKVFSNNKLGCFKTNVCAGKNYYDLGVLKI